MDYTKRHTKGHFPYLFLVGISLLFFVQCTTSRADNVPVDHSKVEIAEVPEIPEIPELPIAYHLVATKDTLEWLKSLEPGDTLTALMVVNRIDGWRLKHLDTLVFPDSIGTGIEMYSPFPRKVEELNDIHKIMLISHYAQAFGVYEKGELIRWGPVSMGKSYSPTPTGLFATNWKSKKTTSTINSSWILEWYFNLSNYEGIGMHEYALPGYPASHGCVRLYRDDANWLYSWADQWVVENSQISVHGTPVMIFDEYPYDGKKPWLLLPENLNALEITSEKLNAELNEFLPIIMERQKKRDSFELIRKASSESKGLALAN